MAAQHDVNVPMGIMVRKQCSHTCSRKMKAVFLLASIARTIYAVLIKRDV